MLRTGDYRLQIHQTNLTGHFAKYDRQSAPSSKDQFSSVLSYFQPAVAWLGLVGCLSVVLIFNSASWWNGNVTAKKVAVAYTGVRGHRETFLRIRYIANTYSRSYFCRYGLASKCSEHPQNAQVVIATIAFGCISPKTG